MAKKKVKLVKVTMLRNMIKHRMIYKQGETYQVTKETAGIWKANKYAE